MAPRFFPLVILLLALCATVRTTATNSSSCNAVSECVAALDAGNTCQLLPVPKSALPPPIRDVGYNLRELRPGVWSYHDGSYFSLLVYANRHLVVIDAPSGSAPNKRGGSGTMLTDAAEEILRNEQLLRIDIIYTHAHFDHIGGATKFVKYMTAKHSKANIGIYATQGARDVVSKSARGRAPTPTKVIHPRGLKLWVCKGLVIHMDIVGGHTADDVLVYIPSSRKRQPGIVHFVDIVFPRWAPYPQVGLTKDVGKYIDAHYRALNYDFDIFSGGHLTHLGNSSDVRKSLLFAQDLLKAATVGIESVTESDLAVAGANNISTPGAKQFGNVWYLTMEIEYKLQIDKCYRILLEKWGCELAGLDVVLRSHCFTAIQYVNIEQ